MNDEKVEDIKSLISNLKYRIEITKRARIKASTRLRIKHEIFERVVHFYSILLLILTVWFLGDDKFQYSSDITKFLLIISLTVTFLSMYLNIKNYKERAGNFETNYQNLDVLLNKLDRKIIDIDKIEIEDIKQYQREYERLLIDKENHIDIDFKEAYIDYKKSQERKKNSIDLESIDRIHNQDEDSKKYYRLEKTKHIILWIYPILIGSVLFIYNLLLNTNLFLK